MLEQSSTGRTYTRDAYAPVRPDADAQVEELTGASSDALGSGSSWMVPGTEWLASSLEDPEPAHLHRLCDVRVSIRYGGCAAISAVASAKSPPSLACRPRRPNWSHQWSEPDKRGTHFLSRKCHPRRASVAISVKHGDMSDGPQSIRPSHRHFR